MWHRELGIVRDALCGGLVLMDEDNDSRGFTGAGKSLSTSCRLQVQFAVKALVLSVRWLSGHSCRVGKSGERCLWIMEPGCK